MLQQRDQPIISTLNPGPKNPPAFEAKRRLQGCQLIRNREHNKPLTTTALESEWI